MDQLAGLVHDAHEFDTLHVQGGQLAVGEAPAVDGVLQLWRSDTVLADVGHDEHVLAQVERLWAKNAYDSSAVSHSPPKRVRGARGGSHQLETGQKSWRVSGESLPD